MAEKHLARLFSVVGGGLCFLLIVYHCDTQQLLIRFSVLPALALNDGIIHCDIVEGAFNSELFYSFTARLLDQMQPFPAPKSVIVMDNCRIHKHPEILELIESRYVLRYTH